MRRALLLVILALSPACFAQTPYTVTTTADSGAGSLRAAITAANANGFSCVNFNLTFPATITINSALPRVVGDLNMTGPGARNLTISGGGGNYRFLTVGDYVGGSPVSGFLSIENLSIENFGGGAIEFVDAPNGSGSSIYGIRLGIRNCNSSTGGGAFLVRGGQMVAQECEISNCDATGGSSGGAIKMLAAGTGYGSSLLFCTTIQGCSAAGNGGAISVAIGMTSGSCQLIGCTVASNTAAGIGGGIYAGSAIVTLRNTIVADNTAPTGPDCGGPAAYTSDGYNLIEDTSGMTGSAGTGDITGQDPQLGALQNNGGQTDTMALPTTSPATDTASLTGLGQMTDARGVAKPYDIAGVSNPYDGSDIGAFELNPGSTGTATVTCVATDQTSSESTPSSDQGTFTFFLSPPTPAAVQLIFTMGGTADFNPGADYFLTASVGALVLQGGYYTYDLPAGTALATLTLDPVDDTVVEGATTEWAVMTLYPVFGAYTIGYAANPQIAIVDNDVSGTPTVSTSVSDGSASEANAATDTAQWAIVMAPAPSAAFTLNFTIGGTADLSSGSDYNLSATGGTLTYTTGPAGTISIGAGTTTVYLTLTAVDDTAIEGGTPETSILTLGTGTGYGLGTAVTGTVSIVDDDIPAVPVVTVSATDNLATEGTPAFDTAEFTVVLSPPAPGTLSILFTMSGAASPSGDYTLSATGGALSFGGPSGTVTVNGGSTGFTITLTAVDDGSIESLLEDAIFTLDPGTGYTIGSSGAATANIADDDGLPVLIVTVGLIGGQQGTAYSQNVTATGGAAPYTWSIITGTLPPGLTFGTSTTNVVGITGTPTSAGTFNITVQCADATTSDTQALTIVIAPSLNGGGGGGNGGGGGGGCAADAGSTGWLALLALLAAFAVTRITRPAKAGDQAGKARN